ncbi:Uncharacterised protein [Wolbachia endosymbiont wPip_Mol of Culex molestus]|nr:Uncharacterised protein [Wolbachia endosymbiont wPip_Mol of Culex molestus]
MYLIVDCIRVTFLNVFASFIRTLHSNLPGVQPYFVIVNILNIIYVISSVAIRIVMFLSTLSRSKRSETNAIIIHKTPSTTHAKTRLRIPA